MTERVRDAVHALSPVIAVAAADVDRTGKVTADTVANLQAAGVFSMLQPAAFGGLEAEPDAFLAVVRDIGAACTSTGWLAGMVGVNAWHLALFDVRAKNDVWGTDPSALACAAYAPNGRLERVPGGFRLTGRWSRCTGARHASWLIAGALVVGADGAAEDFTVTVVPQTDYVVDPSWNAVGLCGIGADDVIVSDAFVPDYRTFGWVGNDLRPTLAPLYRLPQPTLYTHAGTEPIIGAALGLLADEKSRFAAPLDATAMAGADLELSVMQIRRNLAELMDCARGDARPQAELLLRTRRDQVLGFERAMHAVDVGMRRCGNDRALRVWRDVHTARMHAANDVDRVLSVAGQFAFGLPVDELIL